MFFDRNRHHMEEELERIRKSSLSPEQLKADEEMKKGRENLPEEKFTIKDIFAMTIAILSIIIPWLLIIMAGIGLVMFLFLW